MKYSINGGVDYVAAPEALRILLEGIDEDNHDLHITVTREGIITSLLDKEGSYVGTNCYFLDTLVETCS